MKQMYCCERFESLNKMFNSGSSIGGGDFYVSLYRPNQYFNFFVLSFDDGWTNFPDIEFIFCPFCGNKFGDEDGN